MLLNDNLTVRTLVHGGSLPWVQSPAQGIERRMLFRIGNERARATSIVRYAPGSHFPRHVHSGGEEYLVLEGTFQDEAGDYPVGSYVRNPPGTSHAPGSETGCTILVKLWQFRANDQAEVVRRPREPLAVFATEDRASQLLHDEPGERVCLEAWRPGAHVELSNPDGLEVLVLAGGFDEGDDMLTRWSWLRLPAGQPLRAKVSANGATVWLKAGPLLSRDVCPFESEAVTTGEGARPAPGSIST